METNVIIRNKIIDRNSNDYFLILEVGTNYVEVADYFHITQEEAMKKIIDEAALAGADAIKFQTYEADKLAHPIHASKQFEYLKKHETINYEVTHRIITYCETLNLEFMTTLFDEEGLEIFGNKLKAFKVASTDINNKLLLKKINNYGKPVIISVASAEQNEIKRALGWLNECPVIIFYCVGIYNNLDIDKINLATIRALYNNFPNNVIGYSDHSHRDISNEILKYSFLIGAKVFEKHFTLENSLTGNDHEHSFNPKDVKNFKKEISRVIKIYGEQRFFVKNGEEDLLKFGRRSLFVKRDILAGQKILEDDILPLRPGIFITADESSKIVGKKAVRDIKTGEPFKYEDIC